MNTKAIKRLAWHFNKCEDNMKKFRIEYRETCSTEVEADSLEEAIKLINSYEYRVAQLKSTYVNNFEVLTQVKGKPTGQERNMFEAFRVAYKGKKRGLDTELNNLMKHKDWINIIGILYQDKNKYFKGEDVRYIPHLQTFINQRRWEMFADEPVKNTNPYGEQHDWRKS